MQIHELNSGTPAASDVIAMDTGSDTYKATADGLVPTFTSGDAASPSAWASVSTITSGLSLATLFNRISTMVKNVRWLYTMLGTTSISGIGNGTVTGAISTLNSSISNWQSVTLATETYGSLVGYYNSSLKIGCVRWTGNANNAVEGQHEYSLPATLKPIAGVVAPLKDSASYLSSIEVRNDSTIRIRLSGTSWSAGEIMYPLL